MEVTPKNYLSKDYLTKAERAAINNFTSYLSKSKIKKIEKKETKIIPAKPSPILDNQIMTLKEVAEYLSVSPFTIKRWCQAGKIKSIRGNEQEHRKFLREYIMSKYDK